MNWYSTVGGVHHLTGGDSRLKIWIEETNGAGTVKCTASNRFTGKIISAYSRTLDELKDIGELFNNNGLDYENP